ncbi:MAG: hypothetical protein FJ137_14690 [Deltaproteobacteria bacterium]|nr:hypothetical protein [Deltaproteobacteria bacterium]
MVEIKSPGLRATTPVTPAARPVDLSSIPDVSLADVGGCLRRSKQAAALHDDLLKRVADGSAPLSQRDVEGLLARAGAETTDVKTVLAYHAKHSTRAFDDGALRLLSTLDFSDVAAAHVEELKRQNKAQIEGHQRFLDVDRKDFTRVRADDAQKLQRAHDEKQRLQKKSAFELEAEVAAQAQQTGLSEKEATVLLLHRKRFSSS